MNRRLLLRTASLAAIVAPLGLAACSNATSSQVNGDANLIADGLSGLLTDLQAIPSISTQLAKVAPQIQAALDNLKAQAAQIGNTLTSKDVAAAIAQTVGLVATFVTPFFPAAPMVAVAIQAAITLAQGLVVALTPTTAAAATPVRTGMSVDVARQILAAKVGF